MLVSGLDGYGREKNVEYTRKQCAKNDSDIRNKEMETQEITHMDTRLYTVRTLPCNKGTENSASIQNSGV